MAVTGSSVEERVAEGVARREAEAARLEAEMAQVVGTLNAATGCLVGLIGQVLDTEAWAGWGIRSPEQYVGWKCGLERGRARRLVGMARRLGELPETTAALSEGALSEDQVSLIARHAPAESDSEVAAFAREATVSQLRKVLSEYTWREEPPDPTDEPNAEPESRRQASFGHRDDGWWRLSAALPPDEGALVQRAFEAAYQALFDAAETPEERGRICWADALGELAESYLASAAAGRPHHEATMVLLHLKAQGAHLHLGPALPTSLRRYLGCDAWVRPVIDKGAVATSVGRALRIVPNRTRLAVEERDKGCRVPWCGNTRRLECHHVRHWEDGGPTDTANLCCLCKRCHRLHHLGLLGISGNADDPDGLVFTDARGRHLDASGRPAAPGDLRIRGTWKPPSGEPLDPHWVYFNEAARN